MPLAQDARRCRKHRECSPLSAAELQHDAWIRLPKQLTRCPLTSLSRPGLQDLCELSNGAVKIVRIQRPGTARGLVLIHRKSPLAYLDRMSPGAGQVIASFEGSGRRLRHILHPDSKAGGYRLTDKLTGKSGGGLIAEKRLSHLMLVTDGLSRSPRGCFMKPLAGCFHQIWIIVPLSDPLQRCLIIEPVDGHAAKTACCPFMNSHRGKRGF